MVSPTPPGNLQAQAPSGAPLHRPSIAVIVGWILAVPGYVLMGAMLLSLLGLPDMARCRLNWSAGTSGCQPGLFGDVMYVVMGLAVTGLLLAMSIVGLLPFLWSLLYPFLRSRARRRANDAA